MAAQLKRIRSKYEDDMLIKHNQIWQNILKKGDIFHKKIQDRLIRDKEKGERREVEVREKTKEQGREASEFRNFAKRIVSRAVNDKVEDVVPDELSEENEKYLLEKKEEEKKKPWVGRKGYGRQSKFDEIIVGRGIRNSYSISPIRRPGTAYVDEKGRKDKEPKTQEMGTNTVLTSMVLERILDNLEEVKELMSLTPSK